MIYMINFIGTVFADVYQTIAYQYIVISVDKTSHTMLTTRYI